MAKRMSGDETWFRVRVEVEYDIQYRRFNPKWDYLKETTGDLEGDNPLYALDGDEPVHEDIVIYLGPYNSLQKLETELIKFEGYYKKSETFKNLKFNRGETQTANWVDVEV